MATIQYRISTKVSNGHAELLVRFYDGRRFTQRAKSRVYVPVHAWNNKDGKIIVPKKISKETADLMQLQHRIDDLTTAIYNRWFAEQYDAAPGWLQSVIDEHFQISATAKQMLTVQQIIELCVNDKEISDGTKSQYKVLLEAINRFTKANQKQLYIETLSEEDVTDFEHFFREEHTSGKVIKRSNNTVVTKMKRFRSAVNWAILHKYTTKDPFKTYKIKSEVYGDPTFIRADERDYLYKFTGFTQQLEQQRDIFIFQCNVGCRVSDLLKLTSENIDGDFLQYIAQKTIKSRPTTVRVPLSDTAKEIINKYKGNCNKLLPFINANEYNKCIHEFMQLAGMNRQVIVQDPLTLKPVSKPLYEIASSHMARRTFLETIFRETKSERISASFTGHADGSKAFSRYTKVDDDMKREIIENIGKDL